MLHLELDRPELSGVLVDNVSGLGQPDSDINYTSMASSNFSRFNSARHKPRNIVMSLKYYGDDIPGSRRTVNRVLPTGEEVTIRIITQNMTYVANGYVEKNTPEIFSPESGCNVSIICPDPYLYSEEVNQVVFDAIEPLFHTPFSDANEDEIQVGNIRVIKDKPVLYDGDVETGVVIMIHALGLIRELSIYNVNTQEKMKIDDAVLEQLTGAGIIKGDDIIISTLEGHKYITLTRDGITHNIINALVKSPRPDWFKLRPGENLFTFTASEGEYHVGMKMRYMSMYKGI